MRYGTIVADPPWPYDTAASGRAALPKQMVVDGSRRQIGVEQLTYPTMSIADICALPVREMTRPDAHLYLWVTNAFMDEGYDVVRAWGFAPKTIITWCKTRHDDPTKPSMKQGWWYRGATEHAIFAVKGAPKKRTTAAYPTALMLPRIAQHSRKPDEFFEMVEVVSPPRRLEMFARRPRDGWDVWGNQVESTLSIGVA